MAFTVTRSQSNRAPLGCGGMGDLDYGQICRNCFTIWTKILKKNQRRVKDQNQRSFQHLVESMP